MLWTPIKRLSGYSEDISMEVLFLSRENNQISWNCEYISIHYSAEVKLYIRDALTLYLDGQTHFKYLAARKQMLQDF